MSASVSIVGILNVTPDSFYDGGALRNLDATKTRIEQMVQEGVDIIDVGGESTFVDRKPVSVDEELSRIVPVLTILRDTYPHIGVSVDTYKAPVAAEAIEMGATMINDVTAGRGDEDLFSTVAASNASFVLMHAKDETSRTTLEETEYDNVLHTIYAFLEERSKHAQECGVSASQIILDPGLGFFVSAKAEYSMQVLAHLDQFSTLGYPLYVSPSRKSFLAGPQKLSAEERLPVTIAASAIAVLHGASYIRTHDVEAVRRGCEVAGKIRNSKTKFVH